MSFSVADIEDIKWSLGALLSSIVLAAGLITYSASYQEQALKDRQTAQRQLTEARNQLATAQSDLENMATYLLEYKALEAEKIIGNEQRLDWIEGLEKVRTQKHVLDFKYTIAPQQGYTPNPPLDVGNFALNISPMTLQIDLLHEEQLLHLYAALHSEMQGWFILDHCSMSGSEAPGENTGSLKAECAGGWLTMKNRNAP